MSISRLSQEKTQKKKIVESVKWRKKKESQIDEKKVFFVLLSMKQAENWVGISHVFGGKYQEMKC